MLDDYQVNLETGERFIREVKKIIALGKITDPYNSSVSLWFNPYSESVAVHEVKVIRNGIGLDKLKSATVKVFHPMPYEGIIYTDNRNIVLYLSDIREGDVLDYSYTITDDTPFARLGIEFNLSDTVFNKISRRCLAAKDKELHIKNHLLTQDPECAENDTYQEYSWEFYDNEPVIFHPHTPSWYNPIPRVEISTASSWSDIARIENELLVPVFQDPQEEFLTLVHSWKEKHPNSKEDQILSAIRFISNEIRYMSLHEGRLSGFKAHDPNDILERRYGDCKDKAVLLIAFLRLLDVEAYPALVNTKATYEVKNWLPKSWFDHVIVYLEHEGKSYFVDPGIPDLGGRLDTLHVPDDAYGLIVKENSPGLVSIPRSTYLRAWKVCSTFSVNLARRSATLHTENHYLYANADDMRANFEPGFENRRLKENIEALTRRFGGEATSLRPLKIEDNIEENKVVLKGAYSLKNLGKEAAGHTVLYDFKPQIISCLSFADVDPDRTAPLAVWSEEREETIDITFDQAPIGIKESHVKYQDDDFAYEVKWKKISDLHFRVVLSYTVFNNWIEAEKVGEFINRVEEFQEKAKVCVTY